MKGIVLCAGLGTRLRPLTNRWPKPAIPLLGAPLFRTTLSTLTRAGITEVGINTHHLPEVMEQVARDECARAGVTLSVSRETPEILGTGGGIRGLRAAMAGDDVVVLNGDVLFALDLGPVISAHRASGAAATMVLLPMPAGATYNAVEVDANGVVRRIAGLGPAFEGKLAPWHFTGVHVLTPKVFDFMAPSGPEDINRDVYQRLMQAGHTVRAHRLEANEVYWSDLGSAPLYAATHQALLFGQVPVQHFGAANPFEGLRREGNAWVHPTAHLADAKVSGPAFFAAGSRCDAGVWVGAAVSVGVNAVVGAGAKLNRVAVLDGARVEPGTLLEDSIVAPDGVIVSTR